MRYCSRRPRMHPAHAADVKPQIRPITQSRTFLVALEGVLTMAAAFCSVWVGMRRKDLSTHAQCGEVRSSRLPLRMIRFPQTIRHRRCPGCAVSFIDHSV